MRRMDNHLDIIMMNICIMILLQVFQVLIQSIVDDLSLAFIVSRYGGERTRTKFNNCFFLFLLVTWRRDLRNNHDSKEGWVFVVS